MLPNIRSLKGQEVRKTYWGDRVRVSEVAQLLALCTIRGIDWSLVAREAQRPGGLRRLVAGEVTETTKPAKATAERIRSALPLDVDGMATQIRQWARQGLSLVTILDEDYPLNLRTIHNAPPFLFFRGELRRDDAFAVAVVGTRQPTPDGIRRARRMAAGLARHGVTVVSGLARGVDTEAHEATLQAGGRTIAVLGSGLLRVYPPENAALAERIAQSGAVVSQFWPTAPPAKFNFRIRNVVTSGLGQGTVVIEASSTSGAKMQARLAMEHGKLVFLITSLVDSYPWAATYAKRGAIVVADVRDVIARLRPVEAVSGSTNKRLQLALGLG
jgi:DNA processing protein